MDATRKTVRYCGITMTIGRRLIRKRAALVASLLGVSTLLLLLLQESYPRHHPTPSPKALIQETNFLQPTIDPLSGPIRQMPVFNVPSDEGKLSHGSADRQNQDTRTFEVELKSGISSQRVSVESSQPFSEQKSQFREPASNSVIGRDTTSILAQQTNSCTEVRHIVFLKTHKTGSTTIMNILQRFGEARGLVFALPRSGNYLGFGETIRLGAILPPPWGKTYDLLINHVVYNRELFRKVMPKDSFYLTIVRRPLEQFVSAVEYTKWKNLYTGKIPSNRPATEYLKDPQRYEPQNYKISFTNNRMSFDLGLDHRFFHDKVKVAELIQAVDQDFGFVIVMELINESLLLLKKLLCWSMKDILYVPRNVNSKKPTYNFTTSELKRHKEWDSADYALYDFFLKKIKRQIAAEGEEITEQLKVYKSILATTQKYCHLINRTGSNESLVINASEFNSRFSVGRQDCEYMMMNELPFLDKTRQRYIQTMLGGKEKAVNHSLNSSVKRRPQGRNAEFHITRPQLPARQKAKGQRRYS